MDEVLPNQTIYWKVILDLIIVYKKEITLYMHVTTFK